jgi:hypothetical protein
MSARLPLIVLLALAALAPRARGSAVVVPDQHATVVAAIASNADTVRVRDGVYVEAVTIARPLVLTRFDLEGPPASRPRIFSLTLASGASGWTHVIQFQFDLAVQVDAIYSGPDLWLEDCVLGSALQRGSTLGPRLKVTGCDLMGASDVAAWSLEFTGNRVEAGGLNAEYEAFATIADNWFWDAPEFAITLGDNDCNGIVEDNVIWNCVGGIRVVDPCGTHIERNLVEHCAGDGVATEYAHQHGQAHITGNVLRDLGGDGISLGNAGGAVHGNTIERVGAAGLRIASGASAGLVSGNRVTDANEAGVLTEEGASLWRFVGNTVLHAGGPGALLRDVERADSNVIGRCRGDGIRVLATTGAFGAVHNTLYLNGGSGLSVNSEHDGAVTANIGYGNDLWAVDWSGGGVATLGCNLGFGNLAGNAQGAEPAETDRDGNPLFCDLPADDVHIGPGSAAILAGCETAGARGPGCSQSADVGGEATAGDVRFGPQPARSSLRFESVSRAPVRLELFDAAGARRWTRVLPAGRASIDWDVRDTRGERLAPGVYFLRATAAERTTHTRLVIVP